MEKKIVEDKIREEIIVASIPVFETYGLIKVSMKDISLASGKARTTLYSYFKNKEEVFDAAVEKELLSMFQNIAAVVSPAANLTDNIANFQMKKLIDLRAVIKKKALVFRDLRHDPIALFSKTRILLAEETALYQKVIAWAVESKEIKHMSANEIKFLAETIVITMRGFEIEIILFDRFPDFEEKITSIASLFRYGLQ